MRLSDLRRVNRRAIHAAGPRYMPGQDPAAPNLQIAAVTEALDALALAQDFRTRVEALRSNIQKAFGEAPSTFREELRARTNNRDALIRALADLRDAASSDAGEAAAQVRRTAVAVSRLAGRRLTVRRKP